MCRSTGARTAPLAGLVFRIWTVMVAYGHGVSTREVDDLPDARAVAEQFERMATLDDRFPDVATLLTDAKEDLLAFSVFLGPTGAWSGRPTPLGSTTLPKTRLKPHSVGADSCGVRFMRNRCLSSEEPLPMTSETDRTYGWGIAPTEAPVATRTARFGAGRRMAMLVERRPKLLGFVVSVVVARIILSVLTATEEPDGVLPLLITVFLVIEVIMIWRAVQQVRGQARPAPTGSSIGLDRTLRSIERFGAPVIYATTAACSMGAYAVLHL